MKKIITSGRRKKSVAKAVLYDGNGRLRVNNFDIQTFHPEIARLKIMEPILLAGDIVSKVNIDVNIKGGGYINQADAARLAVARALMQFSPKLKETFLNYDRQLLVADIRVKEAAKPNHHGKARAGTQTSYR